LSVGKVNDIQSAYQANYILDRLVEEGIRLGEQKASVAIHNNVLDAWAKCGNPGGFLRALNLLEAMHKRHQDYPDICPSPNTISYHSALTACARSAKLGHPAAPAAADKLIKQMERHSEDNPGGAIHPETQSYANVMLAHANQAHQVYGAAGAAEDWLHYISKRNTEGGPGPDTACFNMVLKAWKSCPEDRAADRALELLNLMIKLFHDGHHEMVSPNERSFGQVIDAFAERSRPEEAEAVLKMALSFFLDDEQVRRKLPDRQIDLRQCFNIVINGWAKSGGSDAPERATALLMDMRAIAKETYLVRTEPDVFTHTSCMEAIANSGRDDAPEIVESRLFSMIEQHRTQQYGHGRDYDEMAPLPNGATFDCAIRTWHRSEKPNKGERMEDILNTSIDLAQRHDQADMLPRPRTVNMCLKAWAPTDESKALDILIRMEIVRCVDHFSYISLIHEFLNDVDEHKGNAANRVYAAAVVLEKFQAQIMHRGIFDWPRDPQQLYNTVLFGLLKLGTGDAADRAYSLLEGMERNTTLRAKPSIASYSCVIRALSKQPSGERTKKAFAIFDHVTQLHHHDKKRKVKLDTHAFLAMLAYLANVKQRWAADQAYNLLGTLIRMHSQTGHKAHQPDFQCYDKCLQAMARCEDLESLQLAVKMLKEFIADFRDARALALPSEASINTVLKFCNLHDSKDSAILADEVLAIKKKLKEEGHLRQFQTMETG
jgi:hypothetical protein